MTAEDHYSAVIRFTDEVVQWELLGTYLGFKNADLEKINRDSCYKVQPAKNKMLLQWIHSGRGTKQALKAALTDTGLQRLAENIP